MKNKLFVVLIILLSVVSLNADWLWAKQATTANNDSTTIGRKIITDSQGNIYTAGFLSGVVSFGSITLTATSLRAYVAKINSDGDFIWAKLINGVSIDNPSSPLAITADLQNNLYITAGSPYSRVIKYDLDGNFIWSKPAGSISKAIAVDANSNVYIAGNPTYENMDIFVTKLDPNGNLLWTKQAGGTGTDICEAIVIDQNGKLIISGYYNGTAATFGNINLTCSTNYGGNGFIAKLDENGVFLWASNCVPVYSSSWGGTSLAIDTQGNTYQIQNTSWGTDISKFNSEGNNLWDVQYPLKGTSIAVDAVGNIIVAGSFMGIQPLGWGNLTSNGGSDMVFIKLNTDGNFILVKQVGGSDYDQINSVCFDAYGNQYFTGFFRGAVTFSPNLTVNSNTRTTFFAKKNNFEIIYPNGNEPINNVRSYCITWSIVNDVNNIKLEYSLDNGTNWQTIVESVPVSVGIYNWIVPDVIANNCLVKMSDVTNTNVYDLSDKPFSIYKLKLNSLNDGEPAKIGSNKNISWTAGSNISNIKIEYTSSYSNPNSTFQTIVSNTSASGSFDWIVPNTPSRYCKIRISDLTNSQHNYISDSLFIIYDINLTAPNGGENWTAGDSHNIEIVSSGVIYKTEYTFNNGRTWKNIESSHPWNVPNTVSDSCKVRISDIYKPEINDISDNFFSILSNSLTLTSPNGGEHWKYGTQKNITWNAINISEIYIEFSLNNGLNWDVITSGLDASSCLYIWTTPDTLSDYCKIRIGNSMNKSIIDDSDECFAIVSEEAIVDVNVLPTAIRLENNYPNPFNPTTSIKFALPKDDFVTLTVYNLKAEQVAQLANGQFNAGYHTVNFNAENLTSGVYIYALQTAGKTMVNKMLLVK